MARGKKTDVETKAKIPLDKPKKKTRQEASAENGKLGGRPSIYCEKYVKLAKEYLKLCVDTETQRVKSTSIGASESTSYQLGIKVKLPTLEGYMVHVGKAGLGISKNAILEWRVLHPRFGEAIKDILSEQANRLINNSISGDYNPMIAKLMLSVNHGYVEKHEVEVDSQGEQAKKAFYETMKGKVDSMPTDEVNIVLTDLLKG